MFFSSFDSNVVFEVVWQISGNGMLKITRYTSKITMNEAAHTISLISPSKSWKSSFSLIRATVIQHPSFYSAVNEPETRFASGMEGDLSDLSRSIRHQEIFEPQPRNFG